MSPEVEKIRDSEAFKRGTAKAAEQTKALLPHESPEQITHRLKVAADNVETAWRALVEVAVHAYQSKTWAAMSYSTWDDYCTGEIGMRDLPKELREKVVHELRQEGMSIRAIAATTGTSVGQAHADVAGVQSLNTSDDDIVDAEIVEDPPARITGLDGKDYNAVRLGQDGRPATAPISDPQIVQITNLITEVPEDHRPAVKRELSERAGGHWQQKLRNGTADQAIDWLTGQVTVLADLDLPAPEPDPEPVDDRSDIPRTPRPKSQPKARSLDEQVADWAPFFAALRLAEQHFLAAGGRHKLEPLVPWIEDKERDAGERMHFAAEQYGMGARFFPKAAAS